ncbi:MAG: hypothetical protein Q4C29_03865, partial [bacterium]|nr:hypothetical protein [bacterium]
LFKLLNRNIKDFNKIILSLGCITFIFLMGLLSYKISNSYAYFTNSVTGNSVIEMTYTKPNLDKSGANAPLLSSNMIPVYYDETNKVWKKASKSNSDEKYKWYDYDNKMWANAVTVTSTNRSTYLNANAGTIIPISDINAMWVWIPRYTYTYLNTNTPTEIQIKFEKGTNSSGTISCQDLMQAWGTVGLGSTISETCTDSANGYLQAGTSTYTHPAFWWDKDDDNVRDEGEELTGIWVGKFEGALSIMPNADPDAGLLQRGLSAFYNTIYNMRNSGNSYGFSVSDEVHMIKNMEWGAVAYLSHSKYGTCSNGACNEVELNSYHNNSSYKTGCGNNSRYYTCDEYDTTSGKLSSTTRNIYGIYDMSGGAYEVVMGDTANADATGMLTGGKNPSETTGTSGFTGYAFRGLITLKYDFPNKRYYDKYSYGTSNIEYTRGKLGDATKEMSPSRIDSSYTSWYSTTASFPESYDSWFSRGYNGLFAFMSSSGYGSGYTSRAVISNLS